MLSTKEKVWAALTLPANLKSIPHGTDVMTVQEFVIAVDSGSLIDYDGHGRWATQTHLLPEVSVYPSRVRTQKDKIPLWVTHVCWYNK